MKSRQGGFILVYVLVTALIIALIAVGLAQMLLLRYTASQRAIDGSRQKLQDFGGLSNALQDWNAASGGSGKVCSPISGFSGSANPGVCGCVLTSNSGSPRVYAHPVGSACQIDVCTAPYKSGACP
ncbi:MAG: type II secretion system protein [Elusimicrobia bacterium]|nr:type II secretion system protein [Elusimicrobiota bacterium]MDE2424910.1 type II secretion system protein [Elusimicrobiota bacterium]